MPHDIKDRKAPFSFALKILFRLTLLGAIVLGLNLLAAELGEHIEVDIRPSNEEMVHGMIMTAAGAYVLLLSIPFVPGAEVGMMLLAAFGPPIVLLVYLCTIAGLTISYTIGRFVPFAALIRVLRYFGAGRAADLLTTLEPMSESQRFDFLMERASSPILPVLFRYRPVGLALLLNMPGNVVIGGGGGLALMAGASRLFTPSVFLATISLAVAPVPLLVHFLGRGVL